VPIALDFNIHFIIAVPNGEPKNATPLGGFAPTLCESSFLVRAASWLPSDILELTPERHASMIACRMSGLTAVHWYPQSPRAIRSEPVDLDLAFTLVLLGPGQDPADYQDWVRKCPTPPTIVAQRGGDLNYGDLTLAGLQKRFLSVCDNLSAAFDSADIIEARKAISRWTPPVTRTLPYTVGGHATITPNLMALDTCGYESPVDRRFNKIGNGLQPYIDQIALTTRSILNERRMIPELPVGPDFPRRPSLSLFAPAMYADMGSIQLRSDAPLQDKRRFQLIKNALKGQSGYGFEARTEQQVQALTGLTDQELSSKNRQPTLHPLMHLRHLELDLMTEAVAGLASSEISAVIRLPNEINRTAGAVRQYSSHYRSAATNPRRTAKGFQELQARISAAVPDAFRTLLGEAEGDIRIIADAHLEWLDCDGLPLCIRRNVSRIPVTPGNLFIAQITAKPILRLTTDDLRKVLVLSALKRDDPIQGIFEIAFSESAKLWKEDLDVEFAEVKSADQLIAALNAFKGEIVIFDGHGSHAPDHPAIIHLQDEACDVWSLMGKIERPPPIVVLSACDTHAAARNHATTANGILALGARAVLASVFPLDAPSAAMFTARLLFRIASFVPQAVKTLARALTWTEIISGMVRMQLLSDFRRLLEAKGIIDDDQSMQLGAVGNQLINIGVDDPFEALISILESSGFDPSQMKRDLQTAVATSSAISYLNMGRPETILVGNGARI